MLQITFYGGFHNSEEITINIKNKEGIKRMINGESHPLDEVSDYQRKKLDKHFCGIKECACGGVIRANYYYRLNKKEELPL